MLRCLIPAVVAEKSENEMDDDEDEEGELVIKEEEDEGVDEEINTESEEDSELKGQGNEVLSVMFWYKSCTQLDHTLTLERDINRTISIAKRTTLSTGTLEVFIDWLRLSGV